MALITTAEERLSQEGSAKLCIFGPAKIGKTSLVKTLDPTTTLVIDMEAGMKALDDCPVDSINVRKQASVLGVHPWEFLRDFACLIAGPNPGVQDLNLPYSRTHYDFVQRTFGKRDDVLGKYRRIFFDSITDTARMAFAWSQTQPEAFSDKKLDPKTGLAAKDTRGAYGLLGQELVGANGLFNQLKHTEDKDLVFVGLLDTMTDDYGRTTFEPQIDGGKAKRELAGIFDEIISMVELTHEATKYRAFVCSLNPWGYPAGDRSGRLAMVEEPHLGKLLDKLNNTARNTQLTYQVPQGDAVQSHAA